MTGNAIPKGFDDFSGTTMVLDCWTEDWYFPNLDLITKFIFDLDILPNQWQQQIRTLYKDQLFLPQIRKIDTNAVEPEF